MSKNRTSRFMPVIVAVSIVAGILIGTFYANHFSGNKLGIINTSSNKLNALLRIIDDQYVDTVNMGELVEDAMPQILGELDPHSSYIPAKDLEAVNSDLKGSFSGIGIQFTIQQDTIHVNNVILHRAKCQQRLVKSSTKHTIVLHKAICNTIELLHRLAIIDKKAVVTGGYQNLATIG